MKNQKHGGQDFTVSPLVYLVLLISKLPSMSFILFYIVTTHNLYNRQVADYIGTVHHEFTFTVEEGIDALSDVIYHIETYDVTSIRASTPMYFLSRKIKAMGVKMVLSGEGSDEVFGGYLYFHKAPSKEKFHAETCHKLKLLSKYDCLRANKSSGNLFFNLNYFIHVENQLLGVLNVVAHF